MSKKAIPTSEVSRLDNVKVNLLALVQYIESLPLNTTIGEMRKDAKFAALCRSKIVQVNLFKGGKITHVRCGIFRAYLPVILFKTDKSRNKSYAQYSVLGDKIKCDAYNKANKTIKELDVKQSEAKDALVAKCKAQNKTLEQYFEMERILNKQYDELREKAKANVCRESVFTRKACEDSLKLAVMRLDESRYKEDRQRSEQAKGLNVAEVWKDFVNLPENADYVKANNLK